MNWLGPPATEASPDRDGRPPRESGPLPPEAVPAAASWPESAMASTAGPSATRLLLAVAIIVVVSGAAAMYVWSTLNLLLAGAADGWRVATAAGAGLSVVLLFFRLGRYLDRLVTPKQPNDSSAKEARE